MKKQSNCAGFRSLSIAFLAARCDLEPGHVSVLGCSVTRSTYRTWSPGRIPGASGRLFTSRELISVASVSVIAQGSTGFECTRVHARLGITVTFEDILLKKSCLEQTNRKKNMSDNIQRLEVPYR